MSNLKVEGKVGDFCPNCKNCKAVTRMHDGKNASIRIIEVDCEDPYDGMVKTLDVDSDICCSMFEPKPDKYCKNCERFDGTYCHGSNGTITISYKAVFGEPVNCPSYEEKKETEQFNTIREKNNNIDHLLSLNKELEVKLKNANEVADSWKRDYERIRDQFLCPLLGILYPDNPSLNINVTDLLNDVKNLKVYGDENESMYADLKYWKERCHEAETDVTTLNSKVETLKNKNDKYLKKITDQQATHYKQCARILDLENMVSKLQSGEYDDILAKDIEIKSLQDKYEAAMTGWKDAIDTNDKMIGEKDKQIEELTRRYNMIAKKLNDIHDILKEDPNNA